MGTQSHARAKWLTLASVCLGNFLLVVDLFVVTVALPAISRDFRCELQTAEWTITLYSFVLALLPLAFGRLGDLKGRRLTYMWGLSVFIIASIGCSFSPTIGMLIGMRALQGVGAAALFPNVLSLITHTFDADERGLALGIWGAVAATGVLVGPLVGGLLVRGDEWRWVFFVNVPVGAVALWTARRFVPESRNPEGDPVEWKSVALLSASLGLLLTAFNRVAKVGWTSPIVLVCVFGAAAAAVGWLHREGRVSAPLVPRELKGNGAFLAACAAAALTNAGAFGLLPYLSLLMQNASGYSATQTGLAFLPATIAAALSLPLTGVLVQRHPLTIRFAVIGGAASLAGAGLLFGQVSDLPAQKGALGAGMVLLGLAVGVVVSATSYVATSLVPARHSGAASGIWIMGRLSGTAFGVALLGLVYQLAIQDVVVDERLPVHVLQALRGLDLNGLEPGDLAAAKPLAAQGFRTTAHAVAGLAAVTSLCSGWLPRRA